MKEFEFNDVGVCLNPNIYSHTKNDLTITIKTCFYDGTWRSGGGFFSPNEGCSGSPSNGDYEKKFDTEEEAYNKQFDVMQNMYNNGILRDNDKLRKSFQYLLNTMKEIDFPKEVQLKLFD